jgi:hypothetical protein
MFTDTPLHLVLLRAQVRMSQLDKEGGELRDENSMLHIRLQALEELAAGDWKTKVSY